MAAKIQPLDQPPPPRETLADAIGRHTEALASVDRVNKARQLAEDRVYAAGDALKTAEAARDEARSGERAHLAAAALGEDVGLSVADAAAAVAQAAEDLASARATRDALKERAQRETAEASKAERALHAAVVMVIKAEAPIGDMLARAQQLQRDLVDARLQLRWLQMMNCVPADVEISVRDFLLDVSLPSGTGGNDFGNWSGAQPATEPWLAAAADLKANASAKLPKV